MRNRIVAWCVFWALWIVPGAFPFFGYPVYLLFRLIGRPVDYNQDIFQMTILSVVFAAWGMVTVVITGALYAFSMKRRPRQRPAPFLLVYLLVFSLPFLFSLFLMIFSGQ